MWSIIYRILYPYIFCFVLMGIFAVVSFHGYYKVKNKKKEIKVKNTRYNMVGYCRVQLDFCDVLQL